MGKLDFSIPALESSLALSTEGVEWNWLIVFLALCLPE